MAMGLSLLEKPLPRPMSYSFMADLLEAADARLVEVRVEALKECVFYAVAKLRQGDTVREVDARPSDAINLALRTGCPIYVADQVMQSAGSEIPEGMEIIPGRRKGLEALASEWKAQIAKVPARPTKEEAEKRRAKTMQELLDFLFGAET